MSRLLRISILAALAMSATLASAQGTSASIEERLQQLEAEQAAMKQQLADRDQLIQDLRKELQSQGGAAVQPPVSAAAPAAPGPGQAPQRVDAAALPPAETQGEDPARKPFTPKVDTWGVYDPGKGFLVGKSDFGQLDISAYGMVRYMNQNDDDNVFRDHLGNERAVDTRHDIFSHRIMVFLKGWMGSEKLVYNITLWTVNTTDQDAMFANIGYQFSRKFSLYAGLTGNPGSRSLNGSHPFWLGARQGHGRRILPALLRLGRVCNRRSAAGPVVHGRRIEQQQQPRHQGEPARSQVLLWCDDLVDAHDA